MIVYAFTKSGALRPLAAAPDGPGQYVMADVHPAALTNVARTVGSLTYKNKTFDIVEYVK